MITKQALKKQGRFITCKVCRYKFKHNNIEKRQFWNANKCICPRCKQLYCNKPETERKLFILQDEFLLNRNSSVFIEMYNILINYSKSILLKHFQKSIKTQEDLKYYVENAVSLLIEEYYCQEIDREILTSFGKMLYFKIKQALYNKKEQLIDAESLDYKFEDNNFVQREDKKDYFINENDYSFIDNLYEIIITISEYSQTPFENYMRELALEIHLTKGEKYADRFFREFSRVGKIMYMYTLEIIKNKLKSELEK